MTNVTRKTLEILRLGASLPMSTRLPMFSGFSLVGYFAVIHLAFALGIGWVSAASIGETVGNAAAAPPTLIDFGFSKMNVPRFHRPLLVILVEYDGSPALFHKPNVYDDLVFNPLRFPSVNGYFTEISNGRFSWSRAGGRGPIGPIRLPAADANLGHSSQFRIDNP